MTQPDSHTPAHSPAERRYPGKLVVTVFLVVAVIFAAVLIAIRRHNQGNITRAQQAVVTMRARLGVLCVDPSQPRPADLHERGRCTDAGRLELSLTDAAPEVAQASWVLLGEAQPPAGQLTPAESKVLELKGLTPGPHLLAVMFTSKPVDLATLRQAAAGGGAVDVPAQLLAFETRANELRRQGVDVRTERLQFRLEDGKQIR